MGLDYLLKKRSWWKPGQRFHCAKKWCEYWKFIKHSDFKTNKNIIKTVSTDGLEPSSATGKWVDASTNKKKAL